MLQLRTFLTTRRLVVSINEYNNWVKYGLYQEYVIKMSHYYIHYTNYLSEIKESRSLSLW